MQERKRWYRKLHKYEIHVCELVLSALRTTPFLYFWVNKNPKKKKMNPAYPCVTSTRTVYPEEYSYNMKSYISSRVIPFSKNLFYFYDIYVYNTRLRISNFRSLNISKDTEPTRKYVCSYFVRSKRNTVIDIYTVTFYFKSYR